MGRLMVAMRQRRRAARIAALALAAALLAPAPPQAADTDAATGRDGRAATVRRILDDRCVACHACYNAPCQLDLASWAGLDRGATTKRVYQGTRLTPAEPTRLFIDAHGADQWQSDKGFFSVLEPRDGETPAWSLLGRMLALKRASPQRRGDPDTRWMCPSSAVELALRASLGRDGMPLGFPPLGDEEYAAVMGWLDAGAALPPDPAPTPPAHLAQWEAFLNAPGPRARIVARYLYEHLFLARLYVVGEQPAFFRLVRSATAAPEPVSEIATVRPYDDPGTDAVYYRFVPVLGTPVHKTHITFPLSPQRLARYRRWFLDAAWADPEPPLPGYQPATAANPFETFRAIPAGARYRFFLDNARYFVMSFIRGPVCEGQMAVNVIDDHFHVLFLDPDHDLAVTDPGFLGDSGRLLALPAAGGSDPFESYYLAYKERQRAYTEYRESRYARRYPEGMGLEAIWDGGGTDPDAMLTVFRHFDNAAVVHGPRGGTPKTVWVMDYPIFERIYYLLVAGFNVFGNAFHQASTRLYMDNLRVESEDLFLSFLPRDARVALREHWYRGPLAGAKMELMNPLRGLDRPTRVSFRGTDPKRELIAMAVRRLGAAAQRPRPDPEPGPESGSSAAPAPVGDAAGVARSLGRLASSSGSFVAALPDLTYLLVDTGRGHDLYALIRNKAHANVAFMVVEEQRRLPQEDSVSVLRGVAGSYPNFIARALAAEVPALVSRLQGYPGSQGDDESSAASLFGRFGASRQDPDFWAWYDALNAAVRTSEGIDGARMDLSKYVRK